MIQDEKGSNQQGVCHGAPRPFGVKPLKTKTLSVDTNYERQKTPKSPVYVTFCAILCHFIKKLYTSTGNLFGFNDI